MGKQSKRIRIEEYSWLVKRHGWVDEVHMDNGGITYNVQIADEGRRPFITKWFNDPVPASDFLEGFLAEREEHQ